MAALVSRSIKKIENPRPSPRWGGHVRVIEPPYKLFDPFIFLVHHVHSFAPGERTGFPAHPHRGFETVTYILDGAFDHKDSKGNAGRYGNGDVQWLTTGKGVLHSEMFVTDPKKRTTFDGFQLWLNLPQKLKMSEPDYAMLWAKDIPVVNVPALSLESNKEDGKEVKIKIIAGEAGGAKAKIEKSVPLSYFHVHIPPLSKWSFPVKKEHHALAYFLKGTGTVGPSSNHKEVQEGYYVVFEEDGNQLEFTNSNDSKDLEFLLLEGQPYNEPFAHRGPFVMNTDAELRQANIDFAMGKFGHLEDDDY